MRHSNAFDWRARSAGAGSTIRRLPPHDSTDLDRPICTTVAPTTVATRSDRMTTGARGHRQAPAPGSTIDLPPPPELRPGLGAPLATLRCASILRGRPSREHPKPSQKWQWVQPGTIPWRRRGAGGIAVLAKPWPTAYGARRPPPSTAASWRQRRRTEARDASFRRRGPMITHHGQSYARSPSNQRRPCSPPLIPITAWRMLATTGSPDPPSPVPFAIGQQRRCRRCKIPAHPFWVQAAP